MDGKTRGGGERSRPGSLMSMNLEALGCSWVLSGRPQAVFFLVLGRCWVVLVFFFKSWMLDVTGSLVDFSWIYNRIFDDVSNSFENCDFVKMNICYIFNQYFQDVEFSKINKQAPGIIKKINANLE